MKILGYQFRPELADSGEFVANVQMTADDLERFRAWGKLQAAKPSMTAREALLLSEVADVQRGLYAEMDERDAKEENSGS